MSDIYNNLKIEFISVLEKNDFLNYELTFNSEHYSKKTIEEEFQFSFSKIIICKLNNSIIASSIIWEIYENIEIHHIHVHEQYRRKGIGLKLLNFIVDYGLSKNKARVYLEVKESNIPAVKLYLNMGFVKIRVREKYYKDGTSAIEMYKTL